MLVNSRWRHVGEASHLWAWVQLPTIVDLDSCTRVIKMLGSRRLTRAEEIIIQADAVHYFPTAASEALLNAVIQHEGLRKMDILFHYLGDVGWPEGMDIQLVTQAFTGVTSLALDPHFPTDHCPID